MKMARPGWLDRQMQRAERQMAVLRQWEEGERSAVSQRANQSQQRIAVLGSVRSSARAPEQREQGGQPVREAVE
jgi:hypothetical protein